MTYKKSDFKQNKEAIERTLKTKGINKLNDLCVVSGIPIAVAYQYGIEYLESERDRLLKFYDEEIK